MKEKLNEIFNLDGVKLEINNNLYSVSNDKTLKDVSEILKRKILKKIIV
jgi:hypothetical protein